MYICMICHGSFTPWTPLRLIRGVHRGRGERVIPPSKKKLIPHYLGGVLGSSEAESTPYLREWKIVGHKSLLFPSMPCFRPRKTAYIGPRFYVSYSFRKMGTARAARGWRFVLCAEASHRISSRFRVPRVWRCFHPKCSRIFSRAFEESL